MNKILLIVILLSVFSFKSIAQTKTQPQLSIGGEFGSPVGQASNIYDSVFGGSVKLEVPTKHPGLSMTGTGGINVYLVKLYYTGFLRNVAYLPLELGAKYYFSKIAYVEGDAGASIFIGNNYSASRAAFIYAPIIGVTAPTNHHRNTIDLGLRYEGRVEKGGTVGQIAIRIAYRFKI